MKVFSGHQPNFLPYMGFFYKMYRSDVFVLDDDVQYTANDIINRNYLKLSGQKTRVTVPVKTTFGDRINEVQISYDRPWMDKLLKSVRISYARAPHFDEGYELLSRYLGKEYFFLSTLNMLLIFEIAERFGIKSQTVIASNSLPTRQTSNARNIYQCEALGCDVYYSGIGGKAYNDEEAYKEHGIQLVYSDYTPLQYKQVGKGPFIENLSVLDYIFNCGFVIPPEWGESRPETFE